jgi:hypothetical protein
MASRTSGTSPNLERGPTRRSTRQQRLRSRRETSNYTGRLKQQPPQKQQRRQSPALCEKRAYSSLGHCRLQPLGSPLSPFLRIADFLSDWYLSEGAEAANGICGCSFRRNWSCRMPPGRPGEFWAKATDAVPSSTPAAATAAHACRSTFISFRAGGAVKAGTEASRLSETGSWRSDAGSRMFTASYASASPSPTSTSTRRPQCCGS